MKFLSDTCCTVGLARSVHYISLFIYCQRCHNERNYIVCMRWRHSYRNCMPKHTYFTCRILCRLCYLSVILQHQLQLQLTKETVSNVLQIKGWLLYLDHTERRPLGQYEKRTVWSCHRRRPYVLQMHLSHTAPATGSLDNIQRFSRPACSEGSMAAVFLTTRVTTLYGNHDFLSATGKLPCYLSTSLCHVKSASRAHR